MSDIHSFVADAGGGINAYSVYTRTTAQGTRSAESIAELFAPADLPELDIEGVAELLLYQYSPGPRTVVSGVTKTSLRNRALDRADVTGPSAFENIGSAASHEQLNSLLSSTYSKVAKRAGPMGVMCSGGIDSSANLVGLHLAGVRSSIALTAGFQDSDLDETKYARAVTTQLGVDHRIELISDFEQRDVIAVSAALDEPIGDRAILASYLLLRRSGAGVETLISGEGGDEVWGPPRRWPLEHLVHSSQSVESLVCEHIKRNCCQPLQAIQRMLRDFDLHSLQREQINRLVEIASVARTDDAFQALKMIQWKTWLPNNVIAKDRAVAKAIGANLVCPLMAAPLMYAVASLHPPMHNELCGEKGALRSFISGHVPQLILNRTKHTFRVSFFRLAGVQLINSIIDDLDDRSSALSGVLSPDFLSDLRISVIAKSDVADRTLFILTMLHYWIKDLRRNCRAEPM